MEKNFNCTSPSNVPLNYNKCSIYYSCIVRILVNMKNDLRSNGLIYQKFYRTNRTEVIEVRYILLCFRSSKIINAINYGYVHIRLEDAD